MAKRPLRPCKVPMCSGLTKTGYCNKHQYLEAEQVRYYDRYKRDPEATKFYNSREWRALRVKALERDYGLCRECLREHKITFAVVVDHIKPIKQFWHLRLELSNLQALCLKCHNRKTAMDMTGGGGSKMLKSLSR
ncbi:HNH endonuclease signature motif containing protein [Paenibacillus larvae]